MPVYSFEIEITHIIPQTIEKPTLIEAFAEMESLADILILEMGGNRKSVSYTGEKTP